MRHVLKLALLAALGLSLDGHAPSPAQAAEKCLKAGDKVSGRLTLVKTGVNSFAAVLVTRRPICVWVDVQGGEQRQLHGKKLLLAFDGNAPHLPTNPNSQVTISGHYAEPIANYPGDMVVLHTQVLVVAESDAPPPEPPKFPIAKPGAGYVPGN